MAVVLRSCWRCVHARPIYRLRHRSERRYPLRQATLHPRPQGILHCELRCLLPLPCGLERLVVGLRVDGELAWSRLRGGAGTAGGTLATGWPRQSGCE